MKERPLLVNKVELGSEDYPPSPVKRLGGREVSKRYIIQVSFSFQIFLLRTRKRQKIGKERGGGIQEEM